MSNLQPGQIIQGYKIINQLGKGGMATVYRAYQPSVDRYVALKVLSFQLAGSEEFLGRFKQEARLIARLEHPHILPIYDYGEENGIPYLVMRYLDAGTLKERLQAASLSLEEIDRIFSQLADALGYAHENGVIHRDIKPSNVMLDRRGTVFLTDFGIAKMLEGTTQFTATGSITGTPDYMSPEQAQGLKVDATSDIYSLGIVLFEMLTGKVPFDAETPLAVLLKHISHPLPPPSLLRPGLHPELEKVLLKALNKAPQDRYASIAEFFSAWKLAYQIATAEGETQKTVREKQPEVTMQPESIKPGIALPQELPVKKPTAGIVQPKPGMDVRRKTEVSIRRPKRLWIGVSVGIIALLILTGLGLAVILREKEGGSGNVSQTGVPESKSVQPGWTSWAASNTFYTLVLHDDEIYAGGPGGITVWNKKTGEYRQITTQDGLPSARVMDIAFDDNYHLWVATEDGIARWDGEKWAWYDSADGLDSDMIFTLYYKDGVIWAGSNYSSAGGGLMRYETDSGEQGGSWQRVEGFPSAEEPDSQMVSYQVTKILIDDEDRVWVATRDGMARYDGSNWQVYKVEQGLPNNEVLTLFLDQKGVLWAGTREGGAAYFDGVQFQALPDLRDREVYDVSSIVQGWDGAFWFIGYNAVRYDPENGDWQSFRTGEGNLPWDNLRLALVDLDTESMFISADNRGLLRITSDPGGFKFTTLVVPGIPSYAFHEHILKVPEGSGKNQLIFTTPDGGVDVFDLDQETWQPWLDPSSQDNLWPYLPMPRLFDSLGNSWSGSWDGLWIVSTEKVTVWRTGDGMPSDNVTAIALPRDAQGQDYLAVDASHPAWIATGDGLVEFDGTRISNIYNTSNSSLQENAITRLLVTSDGTVWACEGTWISYRTPDGTWMANSTEELTGNSAWISDLEEAKDGSVWIATHDGGLLRFQDGQWKNIRATDQGVELPVDRINSITLAPDGSLWFGLDRNGAARLDDSNWTVYREGLIHPTVNDIFVDDGTIWFVTEGGVSRLKEIP